jgi:nickel-dependent lactate racemase
VIVRLAFGRSAIAADLRGLRCRVLQPCAPRAAKAPAELVSDALDRPDGTAPLVEMARGRRRVTVLVPDATRKASLPEILPVVFARLAAAGVDGRGVVVLVACGTHPAASDEELEALIGVVPPGARVVQHDSHDASALVPVGTTPHGTVIRLNRLAVEADLVVAISTVQHHYFAGFGGGPKLVFPGVAGYEEIQANHARVLDLASAPPRRDPRCEPGRLEGNPVAEEIAAAAALGRLDLALLMVNGADERPCWAASGVLAAVFPAACRKVRAWYEMEAGPFDRIVVGAGGSPTDHTLIQAHKALEAAGRFAAPGAEVLFVAACDGGAGSPAMEPFLADPTPAAILARLGERYVQYGHTTLRLVEKTARYRVIAVTLLDASLVARLGIERAASVQEVLDRWREEASGSIVGVMAGAPVYPTTERARGAQA